MRMFVVWLSLEFMDEVGDGLAPVRMRRFKESPIRLSVGRGVMCKCANYG